MILSDLGSWPGLKTEVTDFIDELKEYQRDQYDMWTTDFLTEIDNGTLSLETDKQVIFFERGKLMRVGHSDI